MDTKTIIADVKKALAAVGSLFTKNKGAFHTYAVAADTYLNKFKDLEESQVGQFLESEVEGIAPVLAPAIKYVHSQLPGWLAKLDAVVVESGKDNTQLAADGLSALKTLKGVDIDLYATKLTGIAAKISKTIAEFNQTLVTIQQAIVAAPVVHDPSTVK